MDLIKARSLACVGDAQEARVWKDKAAQVEIADIEDRKVVEADLEKGPWFGLR